MAVLDALKLFKFNKAYKATWAIVWQHIQSPPSGADREVLEHLCFIGTLIYAVRYRVALSVGMSETFAKSMALIAVGKAGYDTQMEDDICTVFGAEAGDAEKDYAEKLFGVLDEILRPGGLCGDTELSAQFDQLRARHSLLPA